MAPKDYVKRPQAKKQGTKRNSSSASSAAVPWIKVTVSMLVVGLFIFGLFRLQSVDLSDTDGSGSDPTTQMLNTDVTDTSAVGSEINSLEIEKSDSIELEKLSELPVLGDEEWEYIDSLPDYSVEVDATGPLERGKDFIMQCGSFRTQDRAETLRAKIAFQGLESRILTSNGKNGLWYRVVLGPYERKRNAERHRGQLRNANVNGCKIW
jgi:cell division protein FtsN